MLKGLASPPLQGPACCWRCWTAIIDSYENSPGRGLPIGNLTSQFFANHYLGVLDHHCKQSLGCRRYVRYMDDFVVWDSREGPAAASRG